MRSCTFLGILLLWIALGGWESRAEEPANAAEKEKKTEEQLRLQIFLDQQGYRPGKLDGHQGEFTGKALSRAAQGKAATAETLQAEAQGSAQLWTEYTVQASDLNYVGKVPAEPKDMAELKFLPYSSLGELIAERFHTDLDYLKKLNEGTDLDQLQAGAVVKVPAVAVFAIEKIIPDPKAPKTEQVKKEELNDAAKAGRSVVIHRSEHVLEVWDKGALLASFPVSVGPPDNETPAGEHSVKNITWRPTFRYDKKMLKEGVRGDDAHLLPPGPNNPVGVIWIQTSKDGIGIHGTNDPDLIGRNVSSGCVRLSNWDIVALADMIVPGTKITIN